jgi:hypothetical protein
VKIFTYKPFYIYSKVIGYFNGESIHINSRKINSMSVKEITAHISHEFCHSRFFEHGNNFKTGDKVKYSIPYFVSEYILNKGCL